MKGNVVNNDMSVTDAIGALDSAIEHATTEAGKHSTVHAGNGIKVDPTDDPDTAGNDYTVSLDNDITLTGDDGTNSIHINANAVVVGAYYRPNEDVMFSVGGSMGGGENMVNAGVSLKIGAGSSNVTTSRVAMAKEIKSMRDIVAKQDAQIQKLTAMVNALVGIQSEPDTTTMFPDVPENHWAYEAVEAMAKSGLVKGYPDGEFKGDRTMTRYEFAQIVYNAIQAGEEVDARLVEEFKPELEYFHIATVAKDKDGNPTSERVRANK